MRKDSRKWGYVEMSLEVASLAEFTFQQVGKLCPLPGPSLHFSLRAVSISRSPVSRPELLPVHWSDWLSMRLVFKDRWNLGANSNSL